MTASQTHIEHPTLERNIMTKDNAKKKLSPKFFAEMLTIETNIHTNEFKFEDIDKLIQYYAVFLWDLVRNR